MLHAGVKGLANCSPSFVTRLCCHLWDGMETNAESEMTIRLPRMTLTVEVMAGFMVCTAMVSAQSVRFTPSGYIIAST